VNKTAIEYADYTWNPVTGCLGPNADGRPCSYCYANRLAHGRLKPLYLSHRMAFAGDARNPFAPRFWRNRLEEPLHLREPSTIFVCNMADLFGPWVERLTQDLIFHIVRHCPWHTFLFLTKWPHRLSLFSPWPENAWVGATATEGPMASYTVGDLRNVDAPVRYLSLEPLRGHIDGPFLEGLDWVIIGAQTGPGAVKPRDEWVSELLCYADHYEIPVFLKDNLHWPTVIRQRPTPKKEPTHAT